MTTPPARALEIGLLALVALVAPAAVAHADERVQRYRIEGQDRHLGGFSGTLEVSEGPDGRLWVERRVAFGDGTEQVLAGAAARVGREVRARLQVAAGAAGRLAGLASDALLLRFEVDPASGRCRAQCRQEGLFRSQARGQLLVDEDAVAEGFDPAVKKDPPPRSARPGKVVDAEGRPSLEGTRADGYTVWTGTPFVQGEGDAREIDPNDVKQKGLAHCYFAGALIAVAKTDPEWIRGSITDHRDGQFTVLFRSVHEGGEDARIALDNALPFHTRGDEKVPAFIPFQDKRTVTLVDPWEEGRETETVVYELWPQLLEKAWALHKGGYEAIEWNRASRVFDAISGIESTTYTCKRMTGAEVERVLRRALAAGHPIALGSKKDVGDVGFEVGLVGVHTYVLWQLDEDGRAELYNAWASSHPSRPLTGEEVKASFNRIYVGRF